MFPFTPRPRAVRSTPSTLLSGAGALRVGCTPALGLSVIPTVVHRFAQRFPSTHLSLQTLGTTPLREGLLYGQLDLVVSGYGRFGDAAEPLIIDWRCPPTVLNYRRLLGGNPIPMLTVLVRTALVRGGMPTGPHEDFALWLALFRRCSDLRYGCLPEGLAFYRLHSGNLTGQRWRMAGWAHQVFVAHGLKGAARWMAMARWLAYQAHNLLSRRPTQARSGPLPDLAALLKQPPRPLRPSSS
jgi:DNA-binding transcriptional LysR family regulator